jgi:hypothetical protein
MRDEKEAANPELAELQIKEELQQVARNPVGAEILQYLKGQGLDLVQEATESTPGKRPRSEGNAEV